MRERKEGGRRTEHANVPGRYIYIYIKRIEWNGSSGRVEKGCRKTSVWKGSFFFFGDQREGVEAEKEEVGGCE